MPMFAVLQSYAREEGSKSKMKRPWNRSSMSKKTMSRLLRTSKSGEGISEKLLVRVLSRLLCLSFLASVYLVFVLHLTDDVIANGKSKMFLYGNQDTRIVQLRKSFFSWQHQRKISVAASVCVGIGGSSNVQLPMLIDPDQRSREFAKAWRAADFGSLTLEFMSSDYASRIVWDTTKGPGTLVRDKKEDYYATDDDYLSNPYVDYDEEKAKKHKCRRPRRIESDYFPNCNPFHEFGFSSMIRSGYSRTVGLGEYRSVFSVNNTAVGEGELFVFKEAVFGDRNKHKVFSYYDMAPYAQDGIVSAAILPHPLFVGLYGFCGLSLFTEYLDMGTLEHSYVPLDRCEKTIDFGVNVARPPPLVSENNLTAIQKVQFSLDMAEAIAMFHNHPRGVFVHNDIQLSQFLLSPNGDRVLFNDFNRVEVMMFDPKYKMYCKYYNGEGPGDWRSPEEYRDDPVDEKIDIFSLGNNMYSLLTGVYPFPNLCKYDDAANAVSAGMRSFLDPRWKEHSVGEGHLVEVIRLCWAHEAKDRPSIGEIVKMLRLALQLQQQENGQAEENKNDDEREEDAEENDDEGQEEEEDQ